MSVGFQQLGIAVQRHVTSFLDPTDQCSFAAVAQTCRAARAVVEETPARQKLRAAWRKREDRLAARMPLRWTLHVVHVWLQGPATVALLLAMPVLAGRRLDLGIDHPGAPSAAACVAPLVGVLLIQLLAWGSGSIALFKRDDARWQAEAHHIDGPTARVGLPLLIGGLRNPKHSGADMHLLVASYGSIIAGLVAVAAIFLAYMFARRSIDKWLTVFEIVWFVVGFFACVVWRGLSMRHAPGADSWPTLVTVSLLVAWPWIAAFVTVLSSIGLLQREYDEEPAPHVYERWMHVTRRGGVLQTMHIEQLVSVVATSTGVWYWFLVVLARLCRCERQCRSDRLRCSRTRATLELSTLAATAVLVGTYLSMCAAVGSSCDLSSSPTTAFALPSELDAPPPPNPLGIPALVRLRDGSSRALEVPAAVLGVSPQEFADRLANRTLALTVPRMNYDPFASGCLRSSLMPTPLVNETDGAAVAYFWLEGLCGSCQRTFTAASAGARASVIAVGDGDCDPRMSCFTMPLTASDGFDDYWWQDDAQACMRQLYDDDSYVPTRSSVPLVVVGMTRNELYDWGSRGDVELRVVPSERPLSPEALAMVAAWENVWMPRGDGRGYGPFLPVIALLSAWLIASMAAAVAAARDVYRKRHAGPAWFRRTLAAHPEWYGVAAPTATPPHIELGDGGQWIPMA